MVNFAVPSTDSKDKKAECWRYYTEAVQIESKRQNRLIWKKKCICGFKGGKLLFSEFVRNTVVKSFLFRIQPFAVALGFGNPQPYDNQLINCLVSRPLSLFYGSTRGVVGWIHCTHDAPPSQFSRTTPVLGMSQRSEHRDAAKSFCSFLKRNFF